MLEISDLKQQLSDRPTIICDVDEVVLEFLTPFRNFLKSQNLSLVANSFALNGNVISDKTNLAISNQQVSQMVDDLFANQIDWQTPVQGAAETLHLLSDISDIIFLTAMPPTHYGVRRTLLNSLNMPFPLISTEAAKGPLIKHLVDDRNHASFFIDDMINNHQSAIEHTPKTHNIHIMANDEFRAISPKVHPNTYEAKNWTEIKEFICDKI